MSKLDKAMEKGKPIQGQHQKAKLAVLHDLKKHAMEKMGDKLGHLKKVTVASDSPEGIEKGLDTAKEVLKKLPFGEKSSASRAPASEGEESEHICPECQGEGCEACEGESSEHEASESPEYEAGEEEGLEESSEEEMSPEEIDAKIEELMQKKKELQSHKSLF